MKFYKEEIEKAKHVATSGEHYHIWSDESIRKFWMLWTNNAHLRKQFYPREYFLNFFKQVSIYLNKAESIADIGCGSGTVISVLDELRLGITLIGVDLSEESISKLRERYVGKTKFSFDVGKLSHLPFKDSHCDVVTCTEVLEHLFPDDFEKGLNEVARVLKNGGFFIATIPIGEKINFVICPECQAVFTPYQHMLFEFTEEYIENKLRECGLKLIRFFYPVNTQRPKNIFKYILKNKIMIPILPKIARRLFPMAGVTGFVAQKIKK